MEGKTGKSRVAKKSELVQAKPENLVFALDIGTRSIIGLVGEARGGKLHVLAIEKEEHKKRAMLDGQIEDIEEVARVANSVRSRLEEKLGCTLTKVCVAAAGRALKTQRAFFEMELPRVQRLDDETIGKLEAGAIEQAEKEFTERGGEEHKRQFFLVGYTVSQYLLDHYPISGLKDHRGKSLRADVIATFLPSEVVESIYTTMEKIGLEVDSLTLEPIAAINAAIPQNIRLLNIALVDVGAGTSDIALSRDGSIVGYTMATVAGDEISEALMKHFLVDFNTAERMKMDVESKEELAYTDILGLEHTTSREEAMECFRDSFGKLCREIADKILEVNGGIPSAVFLAGGGSKLIGMREQVAECLGMDLNRVAIAGNNFKINAESDDYDLNDPEYATPLGIAISSALNLINDNCKITLNGNKAKLFRNGVMTILEILMMNGYNYLDMLGRSGRNLTVEIDGRRSTIYGTHATPAVLLVNGKGGKVSDVVRAGDVIEFTPAIHGSDAKAKLRYLVRKEYEPSTTVNNQYVSMDTYLKDGDVVLTGKPIAQASKAMRAKLADVAEMPPDGAASAEGNTVGLHLIKPSQPRSKMSFTVNGKSVELESKEDGLPFYVMDMIAHSGLDVDNPKGIVVLKVNGQEGAYQQELKSGDAVEIYYQSQGSAV